MYCTGFECLVNTMNNDSDRRYVLTYLFPRHIAIFMACDQPDLLFNHISVIPVQSNQITGKGKWED